VVGRKYALQPTRLFLNASAEASITLRCYVEIFLIDHLCLGYPKVERNQVPVIQAWLALALKPDMKIAGMHIYSTKSIRKLPERTLTIEAVKHEKERYFEVLDSTRDPRR
jgi:hypothetical protein